MCSNEDSPAKAQRRKGAKKTQGLSERFASSLRLCVFAGELILMDLE
jgi:hypothetical protein